METITMENIIPDEYEDPDYWGCFASLIRNSKPESGVITTFNFHAAFLNWSGSTQLPPENLRNPIQEFICLMDQTSIGLTVIMTPPTDNKDRIIKEAQLIYNNLKNIRFRCHDHNHSKMLFLTYKNNFRVWNGSQNFHGSKKGEYKYHEMMTEVMPHEISQCEKLIEHLFYESEPLFK